MMRKKILIVDDEANILKILHMHLTKANYEVITADNGMLGIERALAWKPDLMILDILMPDTDGPAIVRAVRENPEIKDTPVIFLTGLLPKNEQQGERKTAGGEYLVAKPFQAAALLGLVKKILS